MVKKNEENSVNVNMKAVSFEGSFNKTWLCRK